MIKYEVEVTMWCDELKKRIEVIAGSFDNYTNAKIFHDAYEKHYRSSAVILEYVLKNDENTNSKF